MRVCSYVRSCFCAHISSNLARLVDQFALQLLLAALTQLTSLQIGDKNSIGAEGAKALTALTLGLEIYCLRRRLRRRKPKRMMMLAKMMLPAGAQTGGKAEMRVPQTGAQTGGTAELRVVVGGKAKAILEITFGEIHIAKEAAHALGGRLLSTRPGRWTVKVAFSTFSSSC